MIPRREAQLPAGAQRSDLAKSPNSPFRAGGLREIRRAGKRPAAIRKKSVVLLPGLEGLTRNVPFANFDAPVLGMRS